MVAVLDVISSLEKYPITKEALEETRLGKLINDVRKKTQNEELAKRAKRLLRSWQKLIEPVAQAEAALRGLAGAGSANGGHHCRPDAAARGLQELKSRLDPPRLPAPRADRPSGRKRRGDPRDLGPPGPAPKLPKAAPEPPPAVPSLSPLPTNGVAGSPEPGDCDRPGGAKIPVNAVRPHAGPPGPAPLDRVDARAPPPRCSFGPRNSRLEGPCARRRSPYAPKGSAPSPSPRPPSLDASRVPSPLPPPSAPLPHPPDPEPPESRWPEPPVGHPRLAGPPPRPGLSPDAASPGPGPGTDSRRKKRYRPRDYTVNLDGQAAEVAAGLKPVRLKERKLTFDPMTRQIRPLAQKEPAPGGPLPAPPAAATDRDAAAPEPPRAEAAQHSPLEQTNWKELSSNGLIQTYLSLRSSLLASGAGAGAGAQGPHLRPEQLARPAHVLLPPPSPPTELPGLGREVSDADVARLQAAEWPGVNGCRDTRGAWFDWTQCIPLDPHGDEGRLNILPYVCLD
ncbi:mediator of RNA polymerase II transcription subunit 26 isoform X2 [Erinaceus europaeus]|nr:mediator of RNA polymerase II transcription subunit 26 isoform X2 [Erinaceus europaeus]